MTTFAQAAARLGSAAREVAGPGSEKALTKAGLEAKQAMNRGAHRDTGADGTLSGYGRRRQRGRVRAEARFEPQSGLRVVVEPTKRSRGLWALLEVGSHRAGSTWRVPRRGTRSRGGTRGTYSRTPVAPRHTWSRAVPKAAREASQAYHREIVQSVFGELRGR